MLTNELIGRDDEIERVRSAVERALGGAGGVVLIEGEAGIGKSSLLSAVMATTRARTLRGAGHELERDRPFGLLTDALANSHPGDLEVAGVVGLLRAESSGADRYQVAEEILDVLERASVEQPLVLAIEDLHWADGSSLFTLSRLVRRLPFVRVCVIGTARPLPHSADLSTLLTDIDEAGAERIVLGPLSSDDAGELARRIIGGPLPPGLSASIGGAGGNPLYVTELARALRDEPSDDTELPPSLRLTIVRRLSFLSDETLDLLRLAAVLGTTFQVGDLCLLGQRAATKVEPLLREALLAEILSGEEDQLAFRHELLRDAMYQDIPGPVRRELHAQAARALAGAEAPALRVATHFTLANDRAAVPWLRRAAFEAMHMDPSVSAELLRRALGVMDEGDSERADVLAELTVALVSSGSPQEAERLALETLAGDPGPNEYRLRLLLHAAFLQQGRNAEALEQMDLLESSEPPELVRGRMLATRANSRLYLGDVRGSVREAKEAIAIADRVGDLPVVVQGANILAQVALFGGDPEGAIAICRSAPLDAPFPTTDYVPDFRSFVRLIHALALTDADRFDEAEDASRKLLESLRGGSNNVLPLLYAERGIRMYRAGAWDEARAELEAGVEAAMERPWGRPLVNATLLTLAVHIEDGALAQRAAAAIESDLASGVAQTYEIPLCLAAQGLLVEWQGEHALAADLTDRAWGRLRFGSIGFMTLVGPDQVRHRRATGDTEGALAAADRVSAAADHAGRILGAMGAALRCRGLASSDPALLLEAVDAYRKTPRPFELALACEDAGTTLANAEAVPLLTEALDRFEDVGAVHDARRVESRLRTLGVRRGRTGTRMRPSTGWEALTPTELEVVELLCEGLTNRRIGERLFISRRTVDTHVGHIFRKVGVGSRTELVSRAVARRQELGEHSQES